MATIANTLFEAIRVPPSLSGGRGPDNKNRFKVENMYVWGRVFAVLYDALVGVYMRMKKAYTLMRPYLLTIAKQWRESWKETANYIDYRLTRNILIGLEAIEERIDLLAIKALDLAIMLGEARHIFMPGKDFCDWLVSCVDNFDIVHAKIVQDFLHDQCGVLHFPTSSKLISFGFILPSELINLEKTPANKLIISFNWPNQLDLKSYGYQVELPYINHNKMEPELSYYAKLILGIGMYLSCFPETMRDGVPEELCNLSMHKYSQVKTILISDKICINQGAGVTPHFRCGHFRILKAERFINKRGQVIFVHETFVKGTANTIVDKRMQARQPASNRFMNTREART